MITREDCEEFAKLNDFKLSEFADKIIARTNANNGYCPCVSERERTEHPENDYECPCSLCKKDVRANGKCHCSLYLRKD